ncbi:MAG: L,D-transpeptidase family protein [Rhodospirillaceae bacterium]
MDICVFPNSIDASQGHALFRDLRFDCSLGRSGVRQIKQEGDGATPLGIFRLRRVLYRADRVAVPITNLPVSVIHQSDGWCDAPDDVHYNQFVKHPFKASAERLWREDSRYDIIAVIGHNDDPIIPGLGSAIFLHIAAEDFSPTEGCVAFEQDDLLTILRHCSAETSIDIRPFYDR